MLSRPRHFFETSPDLYLDASPNPDLKPVLIPVEEPDIDICPEDFALIWACHKPGQPVQGLCTSRGGGPRLTQFLGNITLPPEPADITEIASLWGNDTLTLQITAGTHIVTLGRGEGPMGTDAWIGSEFNHNPGQPYDCTLLVDHIALRFADLIPCKDRFDTDACPASQILSFSGSRPIMPHEIRGFTLEQIELAQAEILVRHGRQYYGEAETAHFTARNWTNEPMGDVPLSRLSETEQSNYFFLKEKLQTPFDPDLAQNSLPAAGGHWEARIEYGDGRSGRLHGADHRLRFVPGAEGDAHWIYLPREGELYIFRDGVDEGIVETDWRAPRLLPTDVLNYLNVAVLSRRDSRLIGEGVTCFTLDGVQLEGEDHETRISGEICLTPDGVPVKADLKGRHDLEGGETPMDWSDAFELKSLHRDIRKRSLGPTFCALTTSARPSLRYDRECVSQCALRMRFSDRWAWRSTPRDIGAGRTK